MQIIFCFVSVRSFVEAAKFMLQNGLDFILSENFNQDPLEQWFGKHRQAGGCNENPTAQQYNYNTSNLRLQGSCCLAPVTGNTRVHRQALRDIDTTPLPKSPRYQ